MGTSTRAPWGGGGVTAGWVGCGWSRVEVERLGTSVAVLAQRGWRTMEQTDDEKGGRDPLALVERRAMQYRGTMISHRERRAASLPT